MKKIGIDARLYSKTGVGVYIRNLLHHLSRQNLSGFQYYVYCLKSDLSAIQLPKDKFIIRPVPYLWHTFGEQLGFCRALMADNLDLMHFPVPKLDLSKNYYIIFTATSSLALDAIPAEPIEIGTLPMNIKVSQG